MGEWRRITLAEGVMQGCPLGPVLFAVGVLQMSVNLHADFLDAVGGAYLDDMPTADVVGRYLEALQERAATTHLQLKLPKCNVH